MASSIRPPSGLSLSTDATQRISVPISPAANSTQISTPNSKHDITSIHRARNPQHLEDTVLPATFHNHPTVLKTRRPRQQRLSQIPIRTYQPYRQDNVFKQSPARPLRPTALPTSSTSTSTKLKPPSTAKAQDPSVLDLLLLNTEQTLLAIQNIDDLYNTASLIIPPYLAQNLAVLDIIEEESWVTKFPDNVDIACKLRAVKSMLVELGLVVARMSEMVKKDKAHPEKDQH